MPLRRLATLLGTCLLTCVLTWSTFLAGPPVLAQEPEPQDELPTYEVQDGDTLLGIAERFDVPAAVLVTLNALEADGRLIVAGQELLLPLFAEQADPEAGCATQHTVVAGDTLWSLAVNWNTTVGRVRELNDLQPGDLLLVGQTLCGPSVPGSVQADALDAAPRTRPVFDPGWVVHPSESFWYTVNLGDTLDWVSARYGLATEALAQANGLLPDDAIQPGQLLLVPASTANRKPWTARYWPVPDLSGEPLLTRGEDAIAHNWFNDAPAEQLPPDSFSAEWTGEFDFAEANYRFIGLADHGLRVYLDDVLLLDNWEGETSGPLTVDSVVTAGTHEVRVEYWEETGPAMVYVLWFESTSAIPE